MSKLKRSVMSDTPISYHQGFSKENASVYHYTSSKVATPTGFSKENASVYHYTSSYIEVATPTGFSKENASVYQLIYWGYNSCKAFPKRISAYSVYHAHRSHIEVATLAKAMHSSQDSLQYICAEIGHVLTNNFISSNIDSI